MLLSTLILVFLFDLIHNTISVRSWLIIEREAMFSRFHCRAALPWLKFIGIGVILQEYQVECYVGIATVRVPLFFFFYNSYLKIEAMAGDKFKACTLFKYL